MAAYGRNMHLYNELYMQPDQDIRTDDRLDFDLMDGKLLQKYLLELKSQRPDLDAVPDDEILERMNLCRDGRPTIAAVMSFSSCPQAYFPQWCVTAVVIPGKKMGETRDEYRFLDNRLIEGPISGMAADAVCFVGRNMHKAMRFTEDARRVDVPEFPLKAVREAVLNALVHRDYSPYTEGSPVRIEMYDDRLEIYNPGGLYSPLTEDPGQGADSLRNPTLASVLETMHIMENKSSGIPLIRAEMQKLGLPEPVFKDEGSMFTVILYNSRHKGKRMR